MILLTITPAGRWPRRFKYIIFMGFWDLFPKKINKIIALLAMAKSLINKKNDLLFIMNNHIYNNNNNNHNRNGK